MADLAASWQPWVHLLSFVANGVVYLTVGGIVRSWPAAHGEAALARRMYVVWWDALAFAAAAQALQVLAALAGVDATGAYVALLLATLAALSAGLCGLVYYVTYLFTGSPRAFVPLLATYATFFLFAAFYVLSSGPSGVLAVRWHVELAYARPPPAAYRAALFAFLVLPQIAGAAAYATLLRRVQAPGQRYRIGLVSAGIVLWSLSTLAQGYRVLETSDAAQLAIRALAMGALLLPLAAYRPPRWVRARLDGASA